MDNKSNIRILKNSGIDYEKWNNVIDISNNSLIYANTCFLDTVSPNWGALVYGDYEYIMPLTVRKKLGITLLEQPSHCQQLGVFPTPSDEILREMFKELKSHFNYIFINFNSKNDLQKINEKGISTEKNLILNLDTDYASIFSSYSSHTKRHLKKADNNKLHFKEYIKPFVYIDFKKKNQNSKVYGKTLKVLTKILPELLSRDRGGIYGVFDDNNEMLASAVFIMDKERLIYINGVSSAKGKEVDAMYFLIDTVIHRFSGSKLYLDFEGSRIPGIARFFEGFGAKVETYYSYKYNNLPSPLRLIKK